MLSEVQVSPWSNAPHWRCRDPKGEAAGMGAAGETLISPSLQQCFLDVLDMSALPPSPGVLSRWRIPSHQCSNPHGKGSAPNPNNVTSKQLQMKRFDGFPFRKDLMMYSHVQVVPLIDPVMQNTGGQLQKSSGHCMVLLEAHSNHTFFPLGRTLDRHSPRCNRRGARTLFLCGLTAEKVA